jgi:hypothetical protein
MNWKTCGVTNVSKSKKKNYRKVGQKEKKLSRNFQKRKKSCQTVFKKLQKVVKKLSFSRRSLRRSVPLIGPIPMINVT